MKFGLFIALSLFLGTHVSQANDAIKGVMKNAFKGDDSLYQRVAKGQGSEEDAKKLAEYAMTLTEQEPPQGEQDSWSKKTEELVKAATSLASGNKQAVQRVRQAGACKACHSVHKP